MMPRFEYRFQTRGGDQDGQEHVPNRLKRGVCATRHVKDVSSVSYTTRKGTTMSEELNAEFKLDTLTRSVRFVASIPPRTATRVWLGVALALEDCATDSAGELLGIKLNQGARALASTVGSIASSVRNGVQSKAERLNASDGPVSRVPALGGARKFIAQAATEAKGTWAAAGYVPIQIEVQPADEGEFPMLTSDGSSTSITSDPVTESEGAQS